MKVMKSIPNMFTLANLYCGFLSIGFSANGHYQQAAIFILIGMVFDSMDGRLARMLHVDSDFGKQLDSLADIVTFGIAPSFLVYYIYFFQFGILGFAVAGLFPLFGAYRLARFNIQSNNTSINSFTGVPITAAGGILAMLILFGSEMSPFVIIIIFILLCFLMVSKLRIPSFKNISLSKYGIIFAMIFGYIFIAMWTNSYYSISYFVYIVTPLLIMYSAVKFVRYKRRKQIDEDSQPQL